MNQFRIHPFVPAKYKKQKPRIENEECVNIRREIVLISVFENIEEACIPSTCFVFLLS